MYFLIVWSNRPAWLEHGNNVAKITGFMSHIWLCIRKGNKMKALSSYKNCPKLGLIKLQVLGAWFKSGEGTEGVWITHWINSSMLKVSCSPLEVLRYPHISDEDTEIQRG